LSENSDIRKDCIQFLVNAILLNRSESKLIELELAKCSLGEQDVQPFIKLIGSNYKLRCLNLKDNDVRDCAAAELLGALMANKYVTKLNLDLNPIRHQIKQDIMV